MDKPYDQDEDAARQQAMTAPAQRERRKQARYEVDESAAIFFVKGGLTLQGRIENLSLSGCRIRTIERCLVDIYTRVEIEFHLQGLPFRLSGVIQSIHLRNTVGIRFLDLSERKQAQITELIGEIEPMGEDRHE
jgi:hypothetical protein